MRRLFVAATMVVGMLAGVADRARAALTFYSDLASYEAATSGNTLIDFEGIAPDTGFEYFAVPPGIDILGVNFAIDTATSNGNLYVIGRDFYYAGTSVLSSQQSSAQDDNMLITLPGAFTAAAFDIGSFYGQTVTVLTSDGASYLLSSPAYPGFTFTGFTSTAAITSIKISQPIGEAMSLDNFRFGHAAAVPEPSSLVLAGVGGLTSLVGLVRRRKRRAN